MFQTKGIHPYLIHFQRIKEIIIIFKIKKKKIIITKISKNHAFILN